VLNPESQKARETKRVFEFASAMFFEGITVALMKIFGMTAEDSHHVSSILELKGSFAGPSDPVIAKSIKQGEVIEIADKENKLDAYEVNYVKDYEAGTTPVDSYQGDDIAIGSFLNEEQQKTLIHWMQTHRINGENIKLRMIKDSTVLKRGRDIDHSNISHSSPDSTIIYIGEYLLKYILLKENATVLKELFDDDEYQHLLHPTVDIHSDSATHTQHLDRIGEVVMAIEHTQFLHAA